MRVFLDDCVDWRLSRDLVGREVSTRRAGERSLVWLDYGRHASPVRRMLRAARAHGVESVWQEIEGADLEADDRLWIAQGLSACGRDEDSHWLRAQIKERTPAGTVPSHR
jgi:hypothetical protein